MKSEKIISLVIPVFNEAANIDRLYQEIVKNTEKLSYEWEIIFVDDGSTDDSARKLEVMSRNNPVVKIIELSRNFGKEAATTAGIFNCRGQACIMMDADLQHPPQIIPQFLQKWQEGAEVIIGVRNKTEHQPYLKKIGSLLFYKIINVIAETKIKPHATDFRLIDRVVIDAFQGLQEKNRMTRALIDWLGFRREYVSFTAPARAGGMPSYAFVKLLRRAVNSFVSLSLFPLRLAGYTGIVIIIISAFLGGFMLFDRYLGGNLRNFTGTAFLAIVILLLVGIILVCLGLIALYIAHIYTEVVNRPLYVVRKKIETEK